VKHALDFGDFYFDRLSRLLDSPAVAALGEVGIDCSEGAKSFGIRLRVTVDQHTPHHVDLLLRGWPWTPSQEFLDPHTMGMRPQSNSGRTPTLEPTLGSRVW
jgi:hypothetical protein